MSPRGALSVPLSWSETSDHSSRWRDSGVAPTAGTARLEVSRVHGLSTLTSACATSPSRLLVSRSRGTCVWACTSSFGGGWVGGDQTRLEVVLGEGTRCFLGTQASTKIYRNNASSTTSHATDATLGSRSVLVLAPDPVQPFANSAFCQKQTFRLASGAGLVLVDWLSAGRTACGERWSFRRYESRNEVFVEGRRSFLDALVLESTGESRDVAARMGRFNALGMVLLLGDPMREAGTRLTELMTATPPARGMTLLATASPLRDGVVLRVAGVRLEDVAFWIRRSLAFLTPLLGGDPWIRKGEEVPR